MHFYEIYQPTSVIQKKDAYSLFNELVSEIDDGEKELDFYDVFPYFKSIDRNRIYVLDSETRFDELIKESLEYGTDDEFDKKRINEVFNDEFSAGVYPMSYVNSFIKDIMAGSKKIVSDGVYICCANLSEALIDNIGYSGDDYEFVEVYKLNKNELSDISSMFTFNTVNIEDDFYSISNDELEENNDFIKLLSRFRVPKNTDSISKSSLIQSMFSFSLLPIDSIISKVDIEKYMYASLLKLGEDAGLAGELVNCIFDKYDNGYKLKREA